MHHSPAYVHHPIKLYILSANICSKSLKCIYGNNANSIPNPEFELGVRFGFAGVNLKVLDFDSQQAISISIRSRLYLSGHDMLPELVIECRGSEPG
ncbi:hypothetical protein RchiOBHm_Chr5g0054011 [Rosa chinensis]|uniref:Uncharacterized protein n=1 Tax=Rosa chinensis TaxID=74649 RepID=A0A2P6QG13_ROSCH|nr:hypothetical protein RchiOBHm_Chr5g0054011 [Rosa chinensis]